MAIVDVHGDPLGPVDLALDAYKNICDAICDLPLLQEVKRLLKKFNNGGLETLVRLDELHVESLAGLQTNLAEQGKKKNWKSSCPAGSAADCG